MSETTPVRATSRPGNTGNDPRIERVLLASGVIAPTLFIVVILIEGAIRPGYDAWIQAASSLSLSDQGWMQIVNFIVSGLLFCAFAVGLRRALSPSAPGVTWGPALLAIVGLGLIVAGVFVTDPAQGYPPGTPPGPSGTTTWHGAIHFFVGGLAVFSLLPVACFVLARTFPARAGRLSGWAAYSVASGVLMWAFFAAFAVVALRGGPAGLYERISLISGFAWVVVLAVRLLRQNLPTAPSSSPHVPGTPDARPGAQAPAH